MRIHGCAITNQAPGERSHQNTSLIHSGYELKLFYEVECKRECVKNSLLTYGKPTIGKHMIANLEERSTKMEALNSLHVKCLGFGCFSTAFIF